MSKSTHCRATTLSAILVSLALSWTTAFADTLNVSSDLKPGTPVFDYVFSPGARKTMFDHGKLQDSALGIGNCEGNAEQRIRTLVLLTPIELPSDTKHPVKGEWWISYDLVRCGETKRYNIIERASGGDRAPEVVAYFPGTTLSSMRLVRDAFPTAAASARAQLGSFECDRRPIVADMRVDVLPHRVVEDGRTSDGVWQETWTFDFCGRRADATMTFTHSERDGGTDFTTSIRKRTAPPPPTAPQP